MRELVLWGHHVDEFQEMFDVPIRDGNVRLLEYGCGPTAVNAELHGDTDQVVSCDPLFSLDKATLSTKTSLIFDQMCQNVRADGDLYDFTQYGSLEQLIQQRKRGLETFFEDYEHGLAEKRYVPAQSDTLPFADGSFDYALSAHYFFSDLDNQDLAFHLKMIFELARVANEVRIFPLIDRFGALSSSLGPVLLGLQKKNFGTEVREAPYRLQKKGNAMLRVWAQQCEVDELK